MIFHRFHSLSSEDILKQIFKKVTRNLKSFRMVNWFHARAKKHSPRQKRRWSLFAKCGLLRFVAELSPSPRVSLRKGRRGKMGRFDPGPFCLRRLLFCPGNEKMGVIDQLNWR